MKKLIKYFFILHTAFIAIIGVGVWLIQNQFFPETYSKGYIIIPVSFYLFGILFITLFRKAPSKGAAYPANLYMLMKTIKIFASLAIITVYRLINKADLRNFAIVFIIFYLINLVWETFIYLRMEKYLKNKSTDKNKHPEKYERIDQ